MINDKRQRTKDKRRKTKDKRRKTSQRLSLDIRHKKMKKHLLIIIATTLTICSCKTLSTHTIGYSADTLHIKTILYDSIFIDRQTLTTYSHDTVYVDRWQNEYRYRLHTDTIYRSYIDTVYTTITLPPEKSPPVNFKYLFVILLFIIVFLWCLRLMFKA